DLGSHLGRRGTDHDVDAGACEEAGDGLASPARGREHQNPPLRGTARPGGHARGGGPPTAWPGESVTSEGTPARMPRRCVTGPLRWIPSLSNQISRMAPS